MGLIFADTFDHYAYADMNRKWAAILTGSTNSAESGIIASQGRRSTYAFRSGKGGGGTSAGSCDSVLTVFPAVADFVLGFAFKWDSTSAGLTVSDTHGSSNRIFSVGSLGAAQLWARVNLDGTISILRGTSPGTVLGTSAIALNQNVYRYLEFKIAISNSAGTVELRIDELPAIGPLTSQDTLHTSSTINDLYLGPCVGDGNPSHFYYDDLYFLDSSGSTSNDFLGDMRGDVMLPNAVGNSSQWTRSTGSDQWATIDEASFNGDTDYNSTATVDNKDTLNFPAAPVPDTNYKFIQLNMMTRKDDAGSATIKGILRESGTDYESAALTPSTSYLDLRAIWDRRPSDNAEISDTDLDDFEFGYKKVT